MSDAMTGDEKMIFAEVGTVTLLTLLFVSVLLCTLAVVWILRRNSNRWLMKSGQKKRGAAFVVMFGLTLAVTGCAGRGKRVALSIIHRQTMTVWVMKSYGMQGILIILSKILPRGNISFSTFPYVWGIF